MKLRTAVPVCLLALVSSAPALFADGAPRYGRPAVYEVTVTNVTRDQSFTPLLVVAHDPRVRLFEPGRPASPELEALAETGNTVPFEETLRSTPGVHGIATSEGLLGPGDTARIWVRGHRQDRISLAGMLIPTNDGFVAINGVGPVGRKGQSSWAPGYDSGTEINDELCASIPGPDYDECGGPGGGGAPDGGEEGFVRIHEGLHGVGDFDAARRDWRNPVAKVSIRRVR
jgi:hypothetical protein